MSEGLVGAAGALRAVAEALSGEAGRLAAIGPGPDAFGASGAGRLGDLGHDLHRRWCECVQARVREAHAFASRCEDVAGALARAAGQYAAADEQAQRAQAGSA